MIRTAFLLASAATMVMAPAVASAAPANPAASLSLDSGARAGSPGGHHNRLSGGTAGLFAIGILAGIAAIIAVAASNDNNNSASN